MPLVRGRKRRSEPEDVAESPAPSAASTPEPPTQRRRLSADEAYGNDDGENENNDSTQQLVRKMVRLALACECQRRPIRRADISEKVLGTSAGRQFKAVFNAAQVELRSVFGMEMVELPSRERITVAQKRAAQKSQSQAAKPVASWILVSTLPSDFRNPAILSPLTAPTAEEEGRYTAMYTLLVSLISLSGGSLPDTKMERYLRRLGVEDSAPMGAPGGGSDRTEKVLKRMEREGYVVKVKETSAAGDDDVYWVVGPRGKVEVGENGVRGLAKAVYGDPDGEEDEELDRRIVRSMGLGDGPPPGATQTAGPKKKRGRRKRDDDADAGAEENDESETSEDE